MTATIWTQVKEELQKAITQRGHPFRFMTMATVAKDATASLRTVVLRKVHQDLTLSIYTDRRTKKVTHILNNNQVSLLLYHPKKMLQIKIDGTAHIINDQERLQQQWSGIPTNSRKDYITKSIPGSNINTPDNVIYLEKEHYFTIIDIVPQKIEYLQLKRPNHIRASFSKENEKWTSTFLVP